jgi:hypothetical protein
VIAVTLVSFKLIAAVWIAIRLHEKRLLTNRTLILGAATWDVLVFALYGLMVWMVPLNIIQNYFVALIAILEVPLVRVAAAPLALAWSRHR